MVSPSPVDRAAALFRRLENRGITFRRTGTCGSLWILRQADITVAAAGCGTWPAEIAAGRRSRPGNSGTAMAIRHEAILAVTEVRSRVYRPGRSPDDPFAVVNGELRWTAKAAAFDAASYATLCEELEGLAVRAPCWRGSPPFNCQPLPRDHPGYRTRRRSRTWRCPEVPRLQRRLR